MKRRYNSITCLGLFVIQVDICTLQLKKYIFKTACNRLVHFIQYTYKVKGHTFHGRQHFSENLDIRIPLKSQNLGFVKFLSLKNSKYGIFSNGTIQYKLLKHKGTVLLIE